MWWANSVLEWLSWAGCISGIALGVGVGTGKLLGHTDFKSKLPTGHSDNCTCATCLIERAERWERNKKAKWDKNKTEIRDREFNYPNALHHLNRKLVSTAELKPSDVVVQRLAGRPRDKQLIRVYKVLDIERKVTEHVVHLLDQIDATAIEVRIPIDQVDQLIWRTRT